jgi:hypothetical protein
MSLRNFMAFPYWIIPKKSYSFGLDSSRINHGIGNFLELGRVSLNPLRVVATTHQNLWSAWCRSGFFGPTCCTNG